jgi:uncharacterized membrane protein YfcA
MFYNREKVLLKSGKVEGAALNQNKCFLVNRAMLTTLVLQQIFITMSATTIIGLLAVGLVAGMLSSMVGIGGGVVIVPALVFLFAMSQKMAQGTSLALLMTPVGIFAVINYYKAGYVDLKFAGVIIVAFVIGSFLGSKIALGLPENTIKKIFGVFLMLVSVKYLFFSK